MNFPRCPWDPQSRTLESLNAQNCAVVVLDGAPVLATAGGLTRVWVENRIAAGHISPHLQVRDCKEELLHVATRLVKHEAFPAKFTRPCIDGFSKHSGRRLVFLFKSCCRLMSVVGPVALAGLVAAAEVPVILTAHHIHQSSYIHKDTHTN